MIIQLGAPRCRKEGDMIDELRKLDAEIGRLVFGEEPDADYRFVIQPADRSLDYRATPHLPHYASDPDASRRIIEWVESRGGTVDFEKLGSFCFRCVLRIGDISEWSDAEATARNKPLSLCIAILRAAGAVLELHGSKHVKLDWALSQGAEDERNG
jgi:hypothetical protein